MLCSVTRGKRREEVFAWLCFSWGGTSRLNVSTAIGWIDVKP